MWCPSFMAVGAWGWWLQLLHTNPSIVTSPQECSQRLQFLLYLVRVCYDDFVKWHYTLFTIPHVLVYVIFAIGIQWGRKQFILCILPGFNLAISLALCVNVCGTTGARKVIFVLNFLPLLLFYSQRTISWEGTAPVKFSTSSRGNPGKKQSHLHLPKNIRRREGEAHAGPRNLFLLQCPKGTSPCLPVSHCQ